MRHRRTPGFASCRRTCTEHPELASTRLNSRGRGTGVHQRRSHQFGVRRDQQKRDMGELKIAPTTRLNGGGCPLDPGGSAGRSTPPLCRCAGGTRREAKTSSLRSASGWRLPISPSAGSRCASPVPTCPLDTGSRPRSRWAPAIPAATENTLDDPSTASAAVLERSRRQPSVPATPLPGSPSGAGLRRPGNPRGAGRAKVVPEQPWLQWRLRMTVEAAGRRRHRAARRGSR